MKAEGAKHRPQASAQVLCSLGSLLKASHPTFSSRFPQPPSVLTLLSSCLESARSPPTKITWAPETNGKVCVPFALFPAGPHPSAEALS